jgi:hypothetical protein
MLIEVFLQVYLLLSFMIVPSNYQVSPIFVINIVQGKSIRMFRIPYCRNNSQLFILPPSKKAVQKKAVQICLDTDVDRHILVIDTSELR